MLLQGARALWENLVNLQPQTSSSGSGISREDYISSAAADIQVCFFFQRKQYLCGTPLSPIR